MYEAFLASGWAPVSFLLELFLFCFGLCTAIAPRRMALVGRLWQRKRDQELSAMALVIIRLGGILLLLITVALWFLFLVAAWFYHMEY